jgi:DNA-binding MarR family transcriptional regulator
MDAQHRCPSERERLADALRDLYLRSHRVVDRMMTEQGASFARTRILLLINRRGPLRSTDIATALGHAPRTVTEAIDALERDGLVRRDADQNDRRAKRISLTGSAKAVIEEADSSRRTFVEDVFGVLSFAECRTFVSLIDRINVRLMDMSGEIVPVAPFRRGGCEEFVEPLAP